MRPGIPLIFVLLAALYIQSGAQTSYLLPEVEVRDTLKSVFHLHPENRAGDASRISPRHSVSQLLSEQTHTFVRFYGPGRLATISQKGASPQQTAILYKGFNMQNPTIGLTDVSLFSGFLFDRVWSGSNSSAIYGSGIVNNGIHLAASSSQQDQLQFSSQYGGLGHWFYGVSLEANGRASQSVVKAYFDGAKNNMRYTGLGGVEGRLPNARNRQGGFLLEQDFLMKGGHRLNFFGTHTLAHREIPPTRLQSRSEATQEDQMGRYGFVYQHFNEKRVLSLRGIWMVDRVDYKDPSTNTNSKNGAETIQLISRYFRKWNEHAQFMLQLDWLVQNGRSNAYAGRSSRSQVAMLMALKKRLPGLNLSVSASNRIQWNEFSGLEWLPFLEANYKISDLLQLYLQVQRTFRVPALDDLFWLPGGNPDLRPESGWHEELGLRYVTSIHNWNHEIQGSLYYRNIRDWILWTPVNAQVWVPQNIARVRSSGIEMSYSGNWTSGDITLEPKLLYTYQHVTEAHADPSMRSRDGNRLVYMPDHQLRATLQCTYRHFGIGIHHRLVSRTFADPQNEQVVPGYQLSNISAAFTKKVNRVKVTTRLMVENALNTDYEVIANYPMPGRLYYVSLTVKFMK